MPKLFVTADTHFSHRNIIKYCSRPYETVEEMNEGIIKIWNDTVTSEDYVFHLGDFAFLGKEKACILSQRLNGKKFLVPGNHDFKKIYTAEEFDFSPLSKIQYLRYGKYRYELSHYPLEDWKDHCHGGVLNLHGHSHGNSVNKQYRIDVGWDVYQMPVDITQFDHYFNQKEIENNADITLTF